MSCRVCRCILPLAVLEVGRFHQDACPVLPRAGAMLVGVFHADQHRVRHLTCSWWTTVATHVGDDHRAVPDAQL